MWRHSNLKLKPPGCNEGYKRGKYYCYERGVEFITKSRLQNLLRIFDNS